MASFNTTNWNKPTPKVWRNIGDAILILGMGLTAMFTALPISDEAKLWIIPMIGFLSPLSKMLTKLFGDDDTPVEPINKQ